MNMIHERTMQSGKTCSTSTTATDDMPEAEADKREQYSRRPNFCFHGIEEKEGEDTNAIVIALVQKKLGLSQIRADQLERNHRIRPKQDEKSSPRASLHCSLSKGSCLRRSVSWTCQLERTQ